MSEDQTRPRRRPNFEVIAGALTVLALVNLAVVLVFGAYDFRVLGARIRSSTPDRPLYILLGFLVLRMALSLKSHGFMASVKTLLPWGAMAAAAGTGVFFLVIRHSGAAVPLWGVMLIWVLTLTGLVTGWLAYRPGRPAAAAVVLVALYLPLTAGLADSLSYVKAWKRAFHIVTSKFDPAVKVPADLTGLLSGEFVDSSKVPTGDKRQNVAAAGVGVEFRKAAVGDEWRNVAAVGPGGFFSAPANVPPGGRLALALASDGASGDGAVRVTAVRAGEKVILLETPVSQVARDKWTEVREEIGARGDEDIVFEYDGQGGGSVLFANPRIERPAAFPHPNVILVLVDTLRADRMSLYGYSRPTTPEIDRLARSAVVFDDYLAQCSWTLPSVASMMTSLYPSTTGVVDVTNYLSPSLDTLAARMHAAGYFTAAVQTNPLAVPQAGIAAGFERFHQFPLKARGALGGPYVGAPDVTRRALSILAEKDERPFFLYLHYMDTHSPYEPLAEFRKWGSADSDLYDAEIAQFSRDFGSLWSALESAGLLSNTIVVLTADHGEQFWEHGAEKHGRGLHSEEIRVPLVVWLPGASEGRRVEGPVSQIDLAPTVLDLAGTVGLENAQGRSVAGVVRGGALADRPVVSELYNRVFPGQYSVAVTAGEYRLIAHDYESAGTAAYELYNLKTDPAEQTNLTSREWERVRTLREHADSVIRAQKALHAKLVPEPPVVVLSEERRKQLEALGYVGKAGN